MTTFTRKHFDWIRRGSAWMLENFEAQEGEEEELTEFAEWAEEMAKWCKKNPQYVFSLNKRKLKPRKQDLKAQEEAYKNTVKKFVIEARPKNGNKNKG